MNGHMNQRMQRGNGAAVGTDRVSSRLARLATPRSTKAQIAGLRNALAAAQRRIVQLLADLETVTTENETLKAENQKLRAALASADSDRDSLETQLEAQTKAAKRLAAEVEAAQGQVKRQAAPFSKGPPKSSPRRPGRKSGRRHGRHAHRTPPRPDQIDATYDARLPDRCPNCGSTHLHVSGTRQQFQIEIPIRPIYRRFNVEVGECQDCGRRVQGHHELQTSDALGAAAIHLGPDAQAGIVLLNKVFGLSHGKVARLYRELFGIDLTRGASARIVLRAAERCWRRDLDELIAAGVRTSPWCVPDETGWRIGGHPAWLHVLVGERATKYEINRHRDADVPAAVLTWDYAGTLVHDGLASYDRFRKATHQQCAFHLMRRIRSLMDKAVGGSKQFLQAVLGLFTTAFAVRGLFAKKKISRDEMSEAYLSLSAALQELVERPRQNPENVRLAKHLRKHLREWFWFLMDPRIDATNARAEQALRPAVVNRKVWGGNRTPRGGRAQATLMSVLETCRRNGHDLMHTLRRLFRGEPIPLANPP